MLIDRIMQIIQVSDDMAYLIQQLSSKKSVKKASTLRERQVCRSPQNLDFKKFDYRTLVDHYYD